MLRCNVLNPFIVIARRLDGMCECQLCANIAKRREKNYEIEMIVKSSMGMIVSCPKKLVTIKAKIVLLYQFITRGWSIEAVIIRYFAKRFSFHQIILTILVSCQRFSFLNSKIQVNYVIILIELESDALDIF